MANQLSFTSQNITPYKDLVNYGTSLITRGDGIYFEKDNTGYFYIPKSFIEKGFALNRDTGKTWFSNRLLLNKDIYNYLTPANISSDAAQSLEEKLKTQDKQNAYDYPLYEQANPVRFLVNEVPDWQTGFAIKASDYYKFARESNGAGPAEWQNPREIPDRLVEIDGELTYFGQRGGGNNFDRFFVNLDNPTGYEEWYRPEKKKSGLAGALATAAGYYLGGPIGAAAVSAGYTAGSGGDIGDILKNAALSYAGSSIGQSLLGGAAPGAETGAFDAGIGLDAMAGGQGLAIPGAATGAYDMGIGLDAMSPPPFTSTTDYSLLGGANLPQTGVGMETGTGITANLPPLPPAETIGITPIDYGSILAPATVPGVVGGIGLQTPTMPNIGTMGGGQGLTVPVEGGTVGQLGLTPTGATPVLGDPGSFINNPDVLGQPVIQQGTPAAGISVTDAVRAANLANNLLAQPQQPQANPYQFSQQMPAGMVDYSSILGLLATRPNILRSLV